MITAKNDGDTAPVKLRISRKDLGRVLQDPALNPDLGKTGAQEIPSVRSDLDEIPCSAGHNACYISAYGDVQPCVAMPIACGNVRDEPFEQIWRRSPQMLRVRSIRIRDLHTCSTCTASQFCTRCPGQALVETGALYGPPPASCEHALVGAQLAGSSAIPASMLRPLASARPRGPAELAHQLSCLARQPPGFLIASAPSPGRVLLRLPAVSSTGTSRSPQPRPRAWLRPWASPSERRRRTACRSGSGSG